MASKIWWRCLELSSIAVVTLYIIAHERLHNIQLSYTTSSPALPSPLPLPRGQSEAAALLCLKSSISTLLLGFLSCTLAWHSFILPPTWTGLALLENQPVLCKYREMWCCPKISAGLALECHKSLFQAITLLALSERQKAAKSVQPFHPFISIFQHPFSFFLSLFVFWEADPFEN